MFDQDNYSLCIHLSSATIFIKFLLTIIGVPIVSVRKSLISIINDQKKGDHRLPQCLIFVDFKGEKNFLFSSLLLKLYV